MKEYSKDILIEAIVRLLVVEGKHDKEGLISEKTGKKMRIAEVEQEFEKIIQEVVESYEV